MERDENGLVEEGEDKKKIPPLSLLLPSLLKCVKTIPPHSLDQMKEMKGRDL